MIRSMLIALLFLTVAGCQRGARLDLDLMVSRAFPDSRVLAMPTAVELIDARGLLFRLLVVHPAPLDLVAAHGTGQDDRQSAAAATEIAALPRFMLR